MQQLPEDVLRRELGPSERLLWFGQPRQGFMLRMSDAFVIPFSLMWGGFAIFWETSVLLAKAPPFFALWGIPFVVIGLHMIAGRFWTDARQRANTFYGVTSERILIIAGLFSQQTKSLNLETLSDLSLSEKPDGSGTIIFGNMPYGAWTHGAAGWHGMGTQLLPQFESIPDARAVYDLIRKTQNEAKRLP
jgi:hypothetical protein